MNVEAVLSEIERARSLEDLRIVLDRVSADLGFAGFNFIDAGRPDLDAPFWMGTTGARWESEYVTNGFVTVDPVLRRARRTNTPFCWSDLPSPRASRGRKSGAHRTMEAARDHGFRDGLVVPFHFTDPIGRVHSSCTCFFWSGPLQRFRVMTGTSARDLHLVMIYWAQRAIDLVAVDARAGEPVIKTSAGEAEPVRLTDRERDVLAWAARGLTMPETAERLGLSEDTVEWHMRNALSKLDAANKTHAVTKAIYLGLIDV
ncbi:LuxR family transcriptional regulator [Stappia sp.]|uniref:LuxR family transcriptional regulator n=1 Tax=Stappia sp. TaxID=1870903 RepID=UPI0032D96CF9